MTCLPAPMANSVSVAVGDNDTMRRGTAAGWLPGVVAPAAPLAGAVPFVDDGVDVVGATGTEVAADESGLSSPHPAASRTKPATAPASSDLTVMSVPPSSRSSWRTRDPAASPRTALASRVWLSHAGPGD